MRAWAFLKADIWQTCSLFSAASYSSAVTMQLNVAACVCHAHLWYGRGIMSLHRIQQQAIHWGMCDFPGSHEWSLASRSITGNEFCNVSKKGHATAHVCLHCWAGNWASYTFDWTEACMLSVYEYKKGAYLCMLSCYCCRLHRLAVCIVWPQPYFSYPYSHTSAEHSNGMGCAAAFKSRCVVCSLAKVLQCLCIYFLDILDAISHLASCHEA